jgi:quercetin dioxygenase-like cupin family protein
MGVTITAFFSDPPERRGVVFTQIDERIRSGSGSVLLESLGYGLEDQHCDPFVVTLKAGASSGRRLMMHPGTELVLCLEGLVDYEVSGEHYRLKPGDSLLFHADLPHRWHNPNSAPAKFVMIMSVTEERHERLEQHLHP